MEEDIQAEESKVEADASDSPKADVIVADSTREDAATDVASVVDALHGTTTPETNGGGGLGGENETVDEVSGIVRFVLR